MSGDMIPVGTGPGSPKRFDTEGPPPEPPGRVPTGELRRGLTSAALRATIEQADKVLPGLETRLGLSISQGAGYEAQTIQEELTNLRRRRDEATLALPHAIEREEEFRQRQQQVPAMVAELKAIFASGLRYRASYVRAQKSAQDALRAVQSYYRERDAHIMALRSEAEDLGGDCSWISSIGLVTDPKAIDELADRLESEAQASSLIPAAEGQAQTQEPSSSGSYRPSSDPTRPWGALRIWKQIAETRRSITITRGGE